MRSRYLPYATRPGRLLAQLLSDVAVVVWIAVWVLVGLAVHSAVATIAEVGRQVQDGATGVSGNLNSAGDSADGIPLVGDTLAKARHLVRQAKESSRRPPKRERPRCGKATSRGPCQAAAWWPADAIGPRKRYRRHCCDK